MKLFKGGLGNLLVLFSLMAIANTQAQEIDIKGNGTGIVDGATLVSTGNFTDMGLTVNCQPILRKYYIYNTGSSSLNLSGSPIVAVSGTNSGDFVIKQQPGSTIAAGGKDSFTIIFTPSATGNRTATISIANNDVNENPYDFAISGFGVNSGNSQLGADIDGEADNNNSGSGVSISADGRIVAIGAQNNSGGGFLRGHVRVYKNVGGTWTQLGSDIDGEADYDFSGKSVSLSSDGSIVAIGAQDNAGGGTARGHVRVFKFVSGIWTKQGADIDGEANNDKSGHSVSLSSDGSIVAIGAINNAGGGTSRGHVRVYKFNSGAWVQQGADIDGESNNDQSGFSVSLSADGLTVAIGAPYNAGRGIKRGHVRVYKNVTGTWTKQGADIDGEANSDLSGYSVSLSADGLILAIGALNNAGGGTQRGHVRVYKHVGSRWIQFGSDIDGETDNDLSGFSVSLSSDGRLLAIGAPQNAGGGTQRGHVKVYENYSGIWTQQGADIDGEANSDKSGYSVSLSADGNIIAIGAINNSGGGTLRGHVRSYSLFTCQEIDIKGNGVEIVDGSTSVSFSNFTNFGTTAKCLPLIKKFYIYNNGGAWLNLKGSSVVVVSGTNSSDFVVSQQPDSMIAPRGRDSFTITFTPGDTGIRNATISIVNNDADENPFDFVITGYGGLISNKQIGMDINGEFDGDFLGGGISINADGGILAVGSENNSGGGTARGRVQIFKSNGGKWIQVGSDINGKIDNELSGSCVSLSSDGSIVAIGIPINNGGGIQRGQVRIYKNISGTWTQLGSDIDGEADGDFSGLCISLSADGGTLAIGAQNNNGAGLYRGHVRVYKNIGGIWTQQGSDIDGEADNDISGHAVSISADGSIVAIGAPQNAGGGAQRGHVRVYKNVGGTWTQIGADIDGEADNDGSGYSVSLSADGLTVAIGAPDNAGGGNESGHVRVYKYVSSSWAQVGTDINGEASNDYSGYSVSLSADGNTVAIGSPQITGGGTHNGQIRVYKNKSGIWTQESPNIDGEDNNELSGYRVSLAADGNIVAIGAPRKANGGADRGQVRVYKIGACQEIDVRGNGLSIEDGTTTVNASNFTDMGITVNSKSIVKKFYIYNLGIGNLRLSESPTVAVSGTNSSDFVISQQPDSIIGPGGKDSFIITFTPGDTGIRNATISIANNDADENPYDFSIQGVFVPTPEIIVKGNGISIADGDITPDFADSTDMGDIALGTDLKRKFWIINSGTDTLRITSIVSSDTNTSEFAVSGITNKIEPGDSAFFTVTITPITLGNKEVTITINNNDVNEGVYDFALKATAICNGILTLSQLGIDIDGEADGDLSGTAVSTSADGSTVAIGARNNAAGGYYRGQVRVYKNISGTWTQQGADIDGEANYDFSGISVSLSADGFMVAVGAPFNAGNGNQRGHVRVFKFISSNWVQLGTDIDGEEDFENSGYAMSLSSDGLTVAIGAPYNAGGGSQRGQVRVYKYISGTWIKQGASINGEADYKQSGYSVSLSDDGLTVAIGAPYNDGGGFVRGHVRVYKNISGTWTQQGTDIDGEADYDNSGNSISLSGDGNSVAIGAASNAGGGSYRGHVRVYKNTSGTWTQQGSDIDGTNDYESSGSSVSLSSDGVTVAISAIYNPGGGNYRGQVRIYKYISGSWTQQGSGLNGEADFDQSGYSVSLSSDGSAVAIGAYKNSGGGNNRGHVRVYGFGCSIPEINVKGNGISIADGDITPGSTDSTDFGVVFSGTKRRFTIENTGNETLNISSITVAGTNAADFSVSGTPTAVAAHDSATFNVKFATTGTGARNAKIIINNNDGDESDYDFNIKATKRNCLVHTTVVTDTMTNSANDSSAFNCANWKSGKTPDSMVNVVVKSGAVIKIRPGEKLKVHNLYFENDAKLLMKGGELKIYGNIDAASFFPVYCDSGKVIFSGTDTNKILNNIPHFYILEINKPSGIVLFDGYGTEVNHRVNFVKGIIRTTAMGGDLEIQSTGSSSEGNANSFAACGVRYAGNSDFVFPTGKGNKWARCAVVNRAGGSRIRAEYFDAGYGQYDTISPLDHVSNKEYWEIQPDGPELMKVKLYWEDAFYSAIDLNQNPSDLVVAHYDGSTSKWEGIGNTSVSMSGQGYVTSSPFNHFSPFTLGSGTMLIPLNVEFVEFTATCNSGQNLLEYRVSETQSGDVFYIERSENNLNFKTVGSITCVGSQQTSFNFAETTQLETGPLYYRIKWKLKNGTIIYSQVAVLRPIHETKATNLMVYPNPANGSFSMHTEGEDKIMSYELRSAIGSFVQGAILDEPANQTACNTAAMPGVYFIQIQLTNGIKICHKIVLE